MSIRRFTALAASLVCSVASTRWPVSDAWIAICAVSKSRISPIMITSGSCRRIARRALAKVRSILAFTCVCPTPGNSYSIGSSTVMMLLCAASSWLRAAYSVVVLPEPVGPVTRMMPCGWEMSFLSRASESPCMPTASRFSLLSLLSSKRNTARSPCELGSVLTRTSTARVPMRREMRPSCGRRFSEMSSSAMIFRREINAACKARLGCTTSRSAPSTRKRTLLCRSYGSMWMSLAPSRAACVSKALSMRMMGASSEVSSRSSTAGRSCIMRDRSASLSTSLTTSAALDSPCAYTVLMRCTSRSCVVVSSWRMGYLRVTSLMPAGLEAGCNHSVSTPASSSSSSCWERAKA